MFTFFLSVHSGTNRPFESNRPHMRALESRVRGRQRHLPGIRLARIPLLSIWRVGRHQSHLVHSARRSIGLHAQSTDTTP